MSTPDERRRELLDRWAELAPDECSYGKGTWCLWGLGGIVTPPDIDDADCALILHHALTCAARRGWDLRLQQAGATQPEGWVCYHADGSGFSPFPDLAVLSAYVSALEAESATP